MKLKLKNGDSINLPIPPPGKAPSFFLISLPKAGSTLFYRIMRPLSRHAGASYFALPNELHDIGLPTAAIASNLQNVFVPMGYAYGGFRGLDESIRLPDFASGRTVFLIRDPRDMLTSLYFSEAFSHRPPGTEVSGQLAEMFEARRKAALSEDIEDFVLRRGHGLLSTFNLTLSKLDNTQYKLYRYEDVIFDKVSWIADTFDYLQLTVPPQRIKNVVSRNDVKPPVAEDTSQHVRRVAPGDHSEKLSKPSIAKLNALFAPILERFGYR